MDSAYKKVTGKTKTEIDEAERKREAETAVEVSIPVMYNDFYRFSEAWDYFINEISKSVWIEKVADWLHKRLKR